MEEGGSRDQDMFFGEVKWANGDEILGGCEKQ